MSGLRGGKPLAKVSGAGRMPVEGLSHLAPSAIKGNVETDSDGRFTYRPMALLVLALIKPCCGTMGYPITSFPVGIKRADRLDGPILPFGLDAPFCATDLSELQNRLWICLAHVSEYAPRRAMRKPNRLRIHLPTGGSFEVR